MARLCSSLHDAAIGLGWARTEDAGPDFFEAGSTEAILEASGNPVELLFCQTQAAAPTAVLATLKDVSALFAPLFNWALHEVPSRFSATVPVRTRHPFVP